MKINSDIHKIKKTIIATRRDIHKHPELSFQEIRTAKLIANRLNQFGLEVQTNVGKTGVIGILKEKIKGKQLRFVLIWMLSLYKKLEMFHINL